MKKIKKNKKGILALSQILILVIGIIAISYAIGSNVEIVSADGEAAPGGSDCIFTYQSIRDLQTREYGVTHVGRIIETKQPTVIFRKDAGRWFYDMNDNRQKDSGEGFMSSSFNLLANNAVEECFEEPSPTIPDTPPQGPIPTPTPTPSPEEGTPLPVAAAVIPAALKEFKVGGPYPTGTTGAPEVGGPSYSPPYGSPEEVEEELTPSEFSELSLLCDELVRVYKQFETFDDCIVNKGKLPEKITEIGEPSVNMSTHFKFLKVKKGYWADAILSGATWAVAVFGGAKLVGSMLGIDESLVDAAAWALAGGVFVGKGLDVLLQEGGALEGSKFFTLGERIDHPGFVWGAAVAIAIFLLTYKKETQEVITFSCYPWDASTGGERCEDCNKQGILPCSEYQCKSLGQSCELLNKGTDEEKCTWINKNDVAYPIIEPLEDALLEDYDYKPDNTISPPDRGVKVEYTESTTGCVKAFTPFSFGVNLNEPGKCKIDPIRKQTFDNMDFYFGGSSTFKYNHTQVMSLPGPSALESENITVENDGEYELYVKCQDANGNFNTANFVFKYCVEKGPDTTPPLIAGTSIPTGYPIGYDITSVDVEVYINEPAECRWSQLDQSYDDMKEGMDCTRADSVLDMNNNGLYTCEATLTGLKNRQENQFYFRCKDQPREQEENRNTNKESYEYILIGTQPLIIDEIQPEDGSTIRDATDVIKVTLEAKTSAGYKEGEATCYYSDTGETASYIEFFETLSYQHSQDLYLPGGEYEYFIKCIDLGGNFDINKTEFTVESDSSSPTIVRAYHEETYLKLVTDEEAECIYDVVDCSYAFDDGIPMSTLNEVNHYTDWNTQINFYIKCQDEYGNQPNPNECSITVRPFEFN